MSDGPSSQGIIIVGPPRSGTTLLRRLLDAHPNIACPPETYLFGACARFLHKDSFAQGLEIGVESGLSFAGTKDGQLHDGLRALAFGLLDDYAKRKGKARWAEKTAFDAFHLDEIRALCSGHVRFICLQRHGLDVVCSMQDLVEKTGGWVDELHPYIRRFPEPLEALAHAWVDAAKSVAKLAREESLAIDVRYEELTENPTAVMRRISEFLGEPWDDQYIETALAGSGGFGFGDWKTYGRSSIDASSVARYKSLPPPSVERLATVCNETLVALGYPQVDLDSSEARDAKRRYELGLLVNRMKAKKAAQSPD